MTDTSTKLAITSIVITFISAFFVDLEYEPALVRLGMALLFIASVATSMWIWGWIERRIQDMDIGRY